VYTLTAVFVRTMMNDEQNILNLRLALPALADRLGRSTSWFRDLRNRDPRFPPADSAGRYGLAEVVGLLCLRDIERMSDAEHHELETERRRMLLLAFEPGGGCACLGAEKRDQIAAVPLRTREEAITDYENDLENFRGLRGLREATQTRAG